MFKKSMMAAALIAAMATPASAFDYSGGGQGAWYLRGDAGVAFGNYDVLGVEIFDMETAFAAGGGFGYQFTSMIRSDITFDAAFNYSRSETVILGAGPVTAKVSADTYTVMLNGYLDVPMFGMFTPYVGAGVGYGWAEAKASVTGVGSISADDDGLALAGMAGVAVGITENVALDIGYKFQTISIEGDDPGEHMFRGGVRFYF